MALGRGLGTRVHDPERCPVTLPPEPICDYLLIDGRILIIHTDVALNEPWWRPGTSEHYSWEKLVELARYMDASIEVLTIAEQIL